MAGSELGSVPPGEEVLTGVSSVPPGDEVLTGVSSVLNHANESS